MTREKECEVFFDLSRRADKSEHGIVEVVDFLVTHSIPFKRWVLFVCVHRSIISNPTTYVNFLSIPRSLPGSLRHMQTPAPNESGKGIIISPWLVPPKTAIFRELQTSLPLLW